MIDRCIALFVIACGVLAGCTNPAVERSQVTEASIHSAALEHNLLGDPADQALAVYLPAAYVTEPARRFATIYFLHGFAGEPPRVIAGNLKLVMDKLIAAHAIEPMIVVVPNGLNKYQGSFYADSTVTGNWATYVVEDVVGYVDSHYRTIADSASRGIAGHSMGGYGALMLAFAHPEIFSNAYAMSPCCTILGGDLSPSSPTWFHLDAIKTLDDLPAAVQREWFLGVVVGMDAAFAPDEHTHPLLGDPPFRLVDGKPATDPDTLARFQSKIVSTAIPPLLPTISKLKGIYIAYGKSDEFAHIPLGARAVSAQLTALGVANTLEAFEGKHANKIGERLEVSLLPWLSRQLKH